MWCRRIALLNCTWIVRFFVHPDMKKVFQKIIKYDTEAHAAKQRYYDFFSFLYSPHPFLLCLVHAISTDNDQVNVPLITTSILPFPLCSNQ